MRAARLTKRHVLCCRQNAANSKDSRGMMPALTSSFSAQPTTGLDGGARRRPSRRVLFNVPGSDGRKLAKAAVLVRPLPVSVPSPSGSPQPNLCSAPSFSAADCIVLDLEDGVAPSKKNDARALIRDVLDAEANRAKSPAENTGKYSHYSDGGYNADDSRSNEFKKKSDLISTFSCGTAERLVRVNSAASGMLEQDVAECVAGAVDSVRELRVALSARMARHDVPPPLAVVLTKVEQAADVDRLLSLLRVHCSSHDAALNTPVLAAIESARGMVNLAEIARSGAGQLSGLIFASEDLCADMGIQRTAGAQELLFFRSSIATHAVANNLDAIDMVCLDFKNTDVVRDEARIGCQMGFTGKQAIHPAQIEPINRAFFPEDYQLDLAERIISGFAQHSAKGVGAFEVDGKMIDMPMVKWAHKIYARAGRTAPEPPAF